jgi:hypothetical protein
MNGLELNVIPDPTPRLGVEETGGDCAMPAVDWAWAPDGESWSETLAPGKPRSGPVTPTLWPSDPERLLRPGGAGSSPGGASCLLCSWSISRACPWLGRPVSTDLERGEAARPKAVFHSRGDAIGFRAVDDDPLARGTASNALRCRSSANRASADPCDVLPRPCREGNDEAREERLVILAVADAGGASAPRVRADSVRPTESHLSQSDGERTDLQRRSSLTSLSASRSWGNSLKFLARSLRARWSGSLTRSILVQRKSCCWFQITSQRHEILHAKPQDVAEVSGTMTRSQLWINYENGCRSNSPAPRAATLAGLPSSGS